MSTTTTPFERVATYFSAAAMDRAIDSLKQYYAPDLSFTGSAFDRLAAASDPDHFTAQDVVAVSMLSVNVPARAALWLIDDAQPSELLRRVPAEANLWEHPELLERDGDAWQLWRAVDAQVGVGAVITSKLLAAKRPQLIPVFDQYVGQALEMGASQWAFWQAVATDPRAGELLESIRSAMSGADIGPQVSVLRAVDVVVWMQARPQS